ncbi:MAG: hypothetical protein GY862_00100 [Gammaproteobacteria bacterium]|nr:hypothetical protein [Gammaproteobacteria bacterium]
MKCKHTAFWQDCTSGMDGPVIMEINQKGNGMLQADFVLALPEKPAVKAKKTEDDKGGNEKNEDTDAGYPDNRTIREAVRKFGWDPIEIGKEKDAKEIERIYKEKARGFFPKIPEIAASGESVQTPKTPTTPKTESLEQMRVMGYGFLAEDQTEFIMSRIVNGQIIFRVRQKNLGRLKLSTDKLIRKLISTKIFKTNLEVSEEKVTISEVNSGEIRYSGRVIPSVLGEALATDVIDIIVSIGPLALMLFIWVIASLKVTGNIFFNNFIGAVFMELDNAMLAVLAASLLKFVYTFLKIWRQAKAQKDEIIHNTGQDDENIALSPPAFCSQKEGPGEEQTGKSNASADSDNVQDNGIMGKTLEADAIALVFSVVALMLLPFAWMISTELSSLAPAAPPKLQGAFVAMLAMIGTGILGLTINCVQTFIRMEEWIIDWAPVNSTACD